MVLEARLVPLREHSQITARRYNSAGRLSLLHEFNQISNMCRNLRECTKYKIARKSVRLHQTCLVQTDRQTDRRDEAGNRYCNCLAKGC